MKESSERSIWGEDSEGLRSEKKEKLSVRNRSKIWDEKYSYTQADNSTLIFLTGKSILSDTVTPVVGDK